MRITGGRWRSRALVAPKGTATRPTSDRVREAVFSMLASDGLLGFGRVLDLYAGSGALAFEALSRGAEGAVLVEQARDALAAIRENVLALDASAQTRVVAAKVDRALVQLEGPFALIFTDPPYAEVRAPGFSVTLAAAAALLAPDGALVLEHASADPAPSIAGTEHDRSRRHGDTTVSLYRSSKSNAP